MNNVSQYAFYGSLRKGMYNFEIYKDHLQYVSTQTLQGFRLYALEYYPIAVRTEESQDIITVELFKITDSTTEINIHNLEIEAGYYFERIKVNGYETGIYLFEENLNYPLVKSGDWVEYFEKTHSTK